MMFDVGMDMWAVYMILFANGILVTNFNEYYKRRHGSVPKSAGPYPVSNMDRVRQFILPEVARFVDSNEGKVNTESMAANGGRLLLLPLHIYSELQILITPIVAIFGLAF